MVSNFWNCQCSRSEFLKSKSKFQEWKWNAEIGSEVAKVKYQNWKRNSEIEREMLTSKIWNWIGEVQLYFVRWWPTKVKASSVWFFRIAHCRDNTSQLPLHPSNSKRTLHLNHWTMWYLTSLASRRSLFIRCVDNYLHKLHKWDLRKCVRRTHCQNAHAVIYTWLWNTGQKWELVFRSLTVATALLMSPLQAQ